MDKMLRKEEENGWCSLIPLVVEKELGRIAGDQVVSGGFGGAGEGHHIIIIILLNIMHPIFKIDLYFHSPNISTSK